MGQQITTLHCQTVGCDKVCKVFGDPNLLWWCSKHTSSEKKSDFSDWVLIDKPRTHSSNGGSLSMVSVYDETFLARGATGASVLASSPVQETEQTGFPKKSKFPYCEKCTFSHGIDVSCGY